MGPIEAAHPDKLLDAAAELGLGDANDEVNGFGDGALRRRWRGFGNEVFEACQARTRIIGVKGCDAARMARVPGFQKIERLGSSHFTYEDAIGTKP